MVAIRLHRLGVEALLSAAPMVSLQRAVYEAAVEEAAGGALHLHRLGVEVLAKKDPRLAVHRAVYEAAAEEAAGGSIRLHRLGVEALAKAPAKLAVQRAAIEAAVETVTGGAIRLHRLGVEILARVGVPDPTPITLAADIEFWMHNWADELEIETSYSTDVTRAPDTLAEERRSLQQRPDRTLTLSWLRQSTEEAYQLRLLLRRLTAENMQIPLYCDATPVTEAAGALDTVLKIDAEARRFFVGARVLIFPINQTYIRRADVITRTITRLTADSITVSSAPGAMAANQWAVVPLLDCEQVLEPEIILEKTDVVRVNLTVREIHGKSALPPLSVGLRTGFPIRLGRPVFEIEPNWRGGVATSYLRYGVEQRIGRRQTPVTDGERYVQVQQWALSPLERADWYRIASLFDSRRGRAESFWAIDREFEWTVANTTSIFIDVVPYGRFEDFNLLWTESNVGAAIKMKDGTIHLMQVNSVSDNGSVWRLTAAGGQTIADPIDLSQIEFFARARISRFQTDAMTERWVTNDVCSVRLSTVEVPNEKTVDF